MEPFRKMSINTPALRVFNGRPKYIEPKETALFSQEYVPNSDRGAYENRGGGEQMKGKRTIVEGVTLWKQPRDCGRGAGSGFKTRYVKKENFICHMVEVAAGQHLGAEGHTMTNVLDVRKFYNTSKVASRGSILSFCSIANLKAKC